MWNIDRLFFVLNVKQRAVVFYFNKRFKCFTKWRLLASAQKMLEAKDSLYRSFSSRPLWELPWLEAMFLWRLSFFSSSNVLVYWPSDQYASWRNTFGSNNVKLQLIDRVIFFQGDVFVSRQRCLITSRKEVPRNLVERRDVRQERTH